MKNSYDKYLDSFNKLDLDDKRCYIIDNLEELIKILYKINIDYNKTCDILKTNNYETEEEYLNELFKVVISLRGVCAGTIDIIGNELYEGANDE